MKHLHTTELWSAYRLLIYGKSNPSLITHCKMIATLLSCRQHKQCQVIKCDTSGLFTELTWQKMFIWLYFLCVCDSGYWPVSCSKKKKKKQTWADRITQVLYSVHVPCDFMSLLSKLSHIMFFSGYRFSFLSTYRETHSAGFSAAGLNACNFIKKKKIKERICNTGMFGSFCGSDHSNPGCPDCLLWACHQPTPSPPLENTSLQVCCLGPSAAAVACVPMSCKCTLLLLTYLPPSIYSHFFICLR